jgi:hypothetical protein
MGNGHFPNQTKNPTGNISGGDQDSGNRQPTGQTHCFF